MELNISEVHVEPSSNRSGHIGFASFVINGNFKVLDCAIYSCLKSPHGIRIIFPAREYKGIQHKSVYPINKEAYECCVAAISNAYRKLMKKLR